MAHSNSIEIAKGPSKWDLSIALFDSQMVNPRSVEFVGVDGQKYAATLQSVQREDGSGESFNIRCYFRPVTKDQKVPSPGRDAEVYYRTDRRTGTIRPAI